jgi:hypothetical protein
LKPPNATLFCMTATRTTTPETLSSPPPVRPPRGVLTAAGLVIFAAALIPWLLTPSSQTEVGLITPTWAAASPQQAAPAQVSAVSNAGSVDRPAGYALFCQNSPSLCLPAASTPPDRGYVLFCQNSPVLCTVAKSN